MHVLDAWDDVWTASPARTRTNPILKAQTSLKVSSVLAGYEVVLYRWAQVYNREFKQRRRRGRRQVKKEFIFYQRSSRLSRSVSYANGFKPRPNDRNMSPQHRWEQHVAPVWPPCCDVLRHVGCCWVILETGQFFMQHLWMLHDVVVVWPGSRNNVASGHAH